MRHQSNIRLTRNTGREAIGAICAWESAANGTNCAKGVVAVEVFVMRFIYSIFFLTELYYLEI